MNLSRRIGTLERPDCKIHYEVHGDAGPAIVFSHGFAGNHMSWFQQIPYFSDRYTCVTFTHRGFAPSSSIEGGPDPADFAADLAALISHLELTDVHLVGQSMGGWEAIEYALTQPPELKAMLLIGSTGTVDMTKIADIDHARLDQFTQGQAAQMSALYARGVHPAAGERMAREQPALHLLYRHIDEQAGFEKTGLGMRIAAMRTRPSDDLKRIACPILYIAGVEDVIVPHFAIEAMARATPAAKLVTFEDAGHSTYFERPDRFNKVADDFFQSLR
jgi:3-oxoadipate enol-lactonase